MTVDGVPDLMTDRAHSARVYDYVLGGKDNYAADRALGDATLEAMPAFGHTLRANRAFMHRATRFLAGAGVWQFLDVGTGIPTEPNLHQIAQAVAPQVRVLYVDNDPIVLAHASALMVSDPRGATAYLRADARDPASILSSAEFGATIDLGRPVALSLIALLHFLDDDEAVRLVNELVAVLPAGSYLALSHYTADLDPESAMAAVARYAAGGVAVHPRSRAEVTRMFLDGLDLVDPGVAVAHRWRPDADTVTDLDDTQVAAWAVVARTG